MPEHYDSSSRVTKLDTRVTILDAFRQGWIPAVDGELLTRFVPDGPVPGMKRKALDRFARGEKARRSGKGRLQQRESFLCSQTGPRALHCGKQGSASLLLCWRKRTRPIPGLDHRLQVAG